MSATLRARLQSVLYSDSAAIRVSLQPYGLVWQTRCLHCRTRLYLQDSGDIISHATLEHIVPQSWFNNMRILNALTLSFSDANDPRNLSIACARCNHTKGITHDPFPDHARSRQVILDLLQLRATMLSLQPTRHDLQRSLKASRPVKKARNRKPT